MLHIAAQAPAAAGLGARQQEKAQPQEQPAAGTRSIPSNSRKCVLENGGDRPAREIKRPA